MTTPGPETIWPEHQIELSSRLLKGLNYYSTFKLRLRNSNIAFQPLDHQQGDQCETTLRQ